MSQCKSGYRANLGLPKEKSGSPFPLGILQDKSGSLGEIRIGISHRQTDRQIYRQIYRQTDRQTETETETETETDRQTEIGGLKIVNNSLWMGNNSYASMEQTTRSGKCPILDTSPCKKTTYRLSFLCDGTVSRLDPCDIAECLPIMQTTFSFELQYTLLCLTAFFFWG